GARTAVVCVVAGAGGVSYESASGWRGRGGCKTDAGGEAHVLALVRRHVGGKLPADALGERNEGPGAVIEVLAQDDELVTADARDGVTGARCRSESLRGGDEDLITDKVAEPVVDGLERVNVDVQEAEVGAVTL